MKWQNIKMAKTMIDCKIIKEQNNGVERKFQNSIQKIKLKFQQKKNTIHDTHGFDREDYFAYFKVAYWVHSVFFFNWIQIHHLIEKKTFFDFLT